LKSILDAFWFIGILLNEIENSKFPFLILLSVGAVAKFSSFGFAKHWLVCRAKPNVLNVRLAFYTDR
jgi:hypothetical protein